MLGEGDEEAGALWQRKLRVTRDREPCPFILLPLLSFFYSCLSTSLPTCATTTTALCFTGKEKGEKLLLAGHSAHGSCL